MEKAFYATCNGVTDPSSAQNLVSKWGDLGVTRIYLLAKDGDGMVTYRSSIAKSRTRVDFDAFGDITRKAQNEGIQIHAWFCCYIESSQNPSDYLKNHPEALLVNRFGKTNIEEPTWSKVDARYSRYWVCASDPGYRSYLTSLMKEVGENYEVDGIHLDYIRYPEAVEGRYYCYCPRCRDHFKQEYGYELPANDVIKNRYYVSIMCENVSNSVEEFSRLAREMGKKISAYVFTDYVTAIEAAYQDWPYFSKFLDTLCPTTYEVSPDHIRTLVKRAKSVVAGTCSLTPVVLSAPEVVRSREGGRRWSRERTIDYVLSSTKACLDSGAQGVVFFIYDGTPPEIREALRRDLSDL